ncbi:hypothetical protein [Microbacterium sediminicola]|uniref:hypothetical protein n=1 Tax=Microbacterium sediminicola TaxID=415210 RepID=UPI0031D04382
MGKYIFGTGIITVLITGFSLVRELRDGVFGWRTILAWASWAITLVLAVGAIVDLRRIDKGLPVSPDSPFADEIEASVKKK